MRTAFALVICGALLGRAVAQPDPLATARSGWQSVRAAAPLLAGTVRVDRTLDDKPFNSRVATVRRRGQQAKLHLLTTRPSGTEETVACRGHDYSFELLKQRGGWVLATFQRNTPGEHGSVIGRRLADELEGLMAFSLEVEGDGIDKLIAAGKVLPADVADTGGRVTLKLTRPPGYKRTGESFIPFQTCAVTLVPDQSYCIAGYECQSQFDNATAEIKMTASQPMSTRTIRLPTEVLVTSRQTRKDRNLTLTTRYVYEFSDSDASNDEFTLSYYGLPEPGSGGASSSYTTLLLIAAAVVVLVVALVLRRRR